MAVEQAPAPQEAPQASTEADQAREAWIGERVAEFGKDAAVRDRAIAMILYDTLYLKQSVGRAFEVMGQGGGLGSMLKMLKGG